MAFEGADVDQLENLAAQFARAAQRLDLIRTSVGGQLGRFDGWQGHDALRFRGVWQSESSRQLSTVAAGLNLAAEVLRRNAAEQRSASGTSGASGGGDVGALFTTVAAIDVAATLNDLRKLDVKDLDAFGKVRGFSEVSRFGVFTGAIGVLGAAYDFQRAAERGDDGGRALAAGNAVVSALGMVPRIGPLGMGIQVAQWYVEATIPLPGDGPGMREAAAASVYGKSVDQLTDAQQRALDRRYDGPFGWANGISDKMDSTANKVKKFFGGVFGG